MKILIGFVMLGMSMVVQASSNSISIHVDKNTNSFIVNLDANPTTGYQWAIVDYDKDLLTLASSVYQQSKPKLIGSGGHMVFTFDINQQLERPKSTTINLKYVRPWERNASGKSMRVNVEFEP